MQAGLARRMEALTMAHGRRSGGAASAWALVAALSTGCGADSPAPAPPAVGQVESAVESAVEDAERAAADGRARPGQSGNEPIRLGNWRRLRVNPAADDARGEDSEERRALEAIGYAQGVELAPETSGVVHFDRDRAQPGLNLYSSGHGTEAILMDMQGRELHRWSRPFKAVWPKHSSRRNHPGRSFWRRVHLFENGDLLAIAEGIGLFKLDRDSKLLWAVDNGAHHDLEVLDGGHILLLTREVRSGRKSNDFKPILEDFVVRLDSEGQELERISLLRAFERSPYRKVLGRVAELRGDVFHTNSLSILDGAHAQLAPAFTAGRVLCSMRDLNAICVVDLADELVVWCRQGEFRSQHDPKLLPNGRLLLFDNRGVPRNSRVLEFDLELDEPQWVYGGTADFNFYSATCGTAERLKNGNTLITESDGGRAFEITESGELVWEFWNPERAGSEREFIAALFEVLRLDPDFPTDWSRAARAGAANSPDSSKD